MNGLLIRLLARAVVLLLIPVSEASGQDAAGPAVEAPALTVSVKRPTLRRWPESIPAAGWLRPWHEAVIASEASGLRITDVLADVGAVVKKGQPLAQLSKEAVTSEINRQQAAVERARANLAQAKANADRARNLRNSGTLSEERIVEYLNAERTATADLRSEEAALESQKIRLEQTTIVAVDDGLITSRSAQLGAVVATGTELFRLVRQQRVEWQAEVAARHRSQIEEGMTATAGLGDGATLRGKVRLIAPTVNSESGRAVAFIELSTDTSPPVGAYATGYLELTVRDALTVPETALVLRDGINYAFVLNSERRARRVRVETGRRNDGEVEILSGVDASADVVTSGGAFLSDNSLVRVAGEAS